MDIAIPITIAVVAIVAVAAALIAEAWYYDRHPEKTPPDVSMWP